jgi:hypothetical protein
MNPRAGRPSNFSWTQPMCDDCWTADNPGREPMRFVESERQAEQCCKCGAGTKSGIYVRVDPSTVTYPTLK